MHQPHFSFRLYPELVGRGTQEVRFPFAELSDGSSVYIVPPLGDLKLRFFNDMEALGGSDCTLVIKAAGKKFDFSPYTSWWVPPGEYRDFCNYPGLYRILTIGEIASPFHHEVYGGVISVTIKVRGGPFSRNWLRWRLNYRGYRPWRLRVATRDQLDNYCRRKGLQIEKEHPTSDREVDP